MASAFLMFKKNNMPSLLCRDGLCRFPNLHNFNLYFVLPHCNGSIQITAESFAEEEGVLAETQIFSFLLLLPPHPKSLKNRCLKSVPDVLDTHGQVEV